MGTRSNLREGRAWMTNATLCLLGVGLTLLAHQFVREYDQFWLGFNGVSELSAFLFVAAVIVVLTQPVNRATFWIVLAFAVAMRAMTVFADPFTSSDMYRYVWDGIVQHAHINPYRYVPCDPALTFLRAPHQEIFDNINRRDYARTIYPPVAQIIYWAATLVSPTVTAMKLVMFGFECITVGALLQLLKLMGRCREEILLYAWCPLLVWEIGDGGHVDAAVLAFVALALLFRFRNKPWLVGLFLGAAFLTKFYPLVLFPALWQRRDWKMPAVIVAMTAAGYAMYSSAGMLVFGFAGGYAKEEGIETGTRYFLLELVQHVRGLSGLPVSAFLAVSAIIFALLMVWAWKQATVEICVPGHQPRFLRIAMAFAFTLMLLFSPHYPWYIVWLIPFFTLVPNLPVLVYLMMFFYMFTTPLADGTTPNMFLVNEILYGTVLVAWVVSWVWKRWSLGQWFVSTERVC
jgi:alpha-1,6-mannosyltransferase